MKAVIYTGDSKIKITRTNHSRTHRRHRQGRSFAIAQALVGAGGTIASLGVFGESCELHLEKLCNRNICMRVPSAMIITDLLLGLRTRLIDAVSTPDLLKMVESSGIDPHFLLSHRFTFDDIHDTYAALEVSSKHGALKVAVTMPEPTTNGSA
ncbi:hypothetical protein CFD26_104737 [Aspergillus turcosus]|uniref:Alcohol dehydrogenase-like C-terminal domain-containing protein n=1 Tax=Aspergillus turcosus TaxID=1245748 RepID=A0A421D0H0_9EURO|nr:hypothetical protein CFD26_104737 [Aspergillus turcosus]